MQRSLKRTIALVIASILVVCGCMFFSACGDEEGENEAKSLTAVGAVMEVRGYEWGPGVPSITIEFADNVSGADKDTLTVKTNNVTRTVTDAYVSDADGNKTSGASKYLTLVMETKYNEASPFTYNMMTQVNTWTESIPYTFSVKSGKTLKVGGDTISKGSWKYSFTREDMRSPDTDVFEKDTYTQGDITLQRAYFTPDGAESDGGKNPLIIWLHGAGEGGTDVEIALLGNEVTALAREEIQSYFTTDTLKGAYVLAVQTPTMWMDDGTGSYNNTVTGEKQESYYTDALYAAITDYVSKNSDIDADRIYLGGCSNGGYMTMNMMFEHGDYFAAFYPICEAYMNGNISDEMLQQVKDYNIWFVHSEDDTTVDPLSTSIPTYYRLINAGATNVNMTLFDHVRGTDDPEPAYSWGAPEGCYMGHWVWIYAFNDQVKTYFNATEAASDYANVTIDASGKVTSANNYVTAANCTEEGNLWQWIAGKSKSAD